MCHAVTLLSIELKPDNLGGIGALLIKLSLQEQKSLTSYELCIEFNTSVTEEKYDFYIWRAYFQNLLSPKEIQRTYHDLETSSSFVVIIILI